jgi:hypothetical protein
MMMEAVSTSETSVTFYETKRRNITEGCNNFTLMSVCVCFCPLSLSELSHTFIATQFSASEFTYFHSFIICRNSADSKRIFSIQKIIIRIMASVKKVISCRELFKKFSILPLPGDFLLSLLSFIVDNMEKLQTN